MSPVLPDKPLRTFKRLWQRAPAWRFSGMLAAVLTLLFVLFFRAVPSQPGVDTASPSNQASYSTQPSHGQPDQVATAGAPLPALDSNAATTGSDKAAKVSTSPPSSSLPTVPLTTSSKVQTAS